MEIRTACGPLILPHGTIKYNDSTAEFSCDHGNQLVGDTTLKCSQWKQDSTIPVCQPIGTGIKKLLQYISIDIFNVAFG